MRCRQDDWREVRRWELRRLGLRLAYGCALLALLAAAWRGSEASIQALVEGLPLAADFTRRLYPADFTVVGEMLRACWETVSIAFLGTAISAVAGLVLGLLAASNLTPAVIAAPVKAVLAFVRSIPLILLALLFVSAVGLGPFPGVLAVAFHGAGMLGKLYADEIEAIDGRILEAIRGVGTGWLGVVRFGALPQVTPQLLSLTLFRFEMNVREATVLGLVGAGGIGYYIQTYARAFQYEKVATMLIAVTCMVLAVDAVSHWTRRKTL
jgi:phosphonate transport system permease protein